MAFHCLQNLCSSVGFCCMKTKKWQLHEKKTYSSNSRPNPARHLWAMHQFPHGFYRTQEDVGPGMRLMQSRMIQNNTFLWWVFPDLRGSNTHREEGEAVRPEGMFCLLTFTSHTGVLITIVAPNPQAANSFLIIEGEALVLRLENRT